MSDEREYERARERFMCVYEHARLVFFFGKQTINQNGKRMNAIKTKWNAKRMNNNKKNGAILSRMLYLLIMWLINRAEHVIELIYVSFVSALMPFYFECQKIIWRFQVEL